MQYFKTGNINISFLQLKIKEMVQVDDLQKIKGHMAFLLEEISYARFQWEIFTKKKDWVQAAKILHREKLIIQQFELMYDESILLKIQKNDPIITPKELKLFYQELISLFSDLEKLIGPSL
jgi:uncharacterized protein YqgQ